MRMRRKKHREERMESCSELLLNDIFEYKDNLSNVFRCKAPLHLEIGCGKGGFISQLAELNPDINYIAFEKNFDVLVLAMEKVQEKRLENVKFFAGNADVLGQLEGQQSVDRLYINFCDPWHKWGHRKRRLTHQRYLEIYKRLMSADGEIHFKTDNAPLFEFSLNSFSEFGMKLKNITLDLHNSKFEGNVMTEYEKLFSEKGQPIYRCEAIFCDTSAAES